MANQNGRTKVYSEFFTNAAVAWFSAGVIAPLFTKPLGIRGFFASALSVFSCGIFLKIAFKFSKEGL